MLISDVNELQQMGGLPKRDIVVARKYSPDNDVTLATKDCLKFMADIPDHSAALVFTSPPYNIGKEYEPRLSLDEYRRTMRDVIAESVRVVRPGGSICFQVGNFMAGPQRPRPLAFILDPLFLEYEKTHGLTLRNAIVWHFEHGQHANLRFSGRYEMILWYTKGDNYVFNLDEVRVPQKYPGKRHHKGPKKGEYSGNPKGKNPGDVWIDIPNVKSNHIEKTEHPCQFPVGLAKRVILAMTNLGDLVIDPFCGVGSTAVAAVLTDRRVATCDLVSDYIATARERVKSAANGTLKIRENKPIHVRSPTDADAKVPDGFWTDIDESLASNALIKANCEAKPAIV